MRSVYNFVVTPIGDRYNNKKKIGETSLEIMAPKEKERKRTKKKEKEKRIESIR